MVLPVPVSMSICVTTVVELFTQTKLDKIQWKHGGYLKGN